MAISWDYTTPTLCLVIHKTRITKWIFSTATHLRQVKCIAKSFPSLTAELRHHWSSNSFAPSYSFYLKVFHTFILLIGPKTLQAVCSVCHISMASIEISNPFLLGLKASVPGEYCLYHQVVVLEKSCRKKSRVLCCDLYMDGFSFFPYLYRQNHRIIK